MSGVEYADHTRLPSRNRTFPRHWGEQPFDLEQRAGWIAGHVAADQIRAGRPGNVRALTRDHATATRVALDPRRALLDLKARTLPPLDHHLTKLPPQKRRQSPRGYRAGQRATSARTVDTAVPGGPASTTPQGPSA